MKHFVIKYNQYIKIIRFYYLVIMLTLVKIKKTMVIVIEINPSWMGPSD